MFQSMKLNFISKEVLCKRITERKEKLPHKIDPGIFEYKQANT